MNIESKIIYDKTLESYIYVYIMIIIICMLSLIIIFMLFNYKTYVKMKGIVVLEDNNYYIRVYLPIDKTKKLLSNNIIKIGKKEYKFKIISIDDEYFTDNKITYQVALLKADIPKKYKFNNLTLDILFLRDNKKIINYILKK